MNRSDALAELAAALGVDAHDLEDVVPMPVRTVTYDEELEMDLGPAIRFQCGEPALTVVEVGPGSVTVAEAGIRWATHTPVLKLGDVHAVGGFPIDVEELCAAIRTAAATRRATFESCIQCGRDLPPEHTTDIDDETICHGCATQHYGVVF